MPFSPARHPLLLTVFALPLKSFGSFMLKRPCLPIKLAMTVHTHCAVYISATHTRLTYNAVAATLFCSMGLRDNNYDIRFITFVCSLLLKLKAQPSWNFNASNF